MTKSILLFSELAPQDYQQIEPTNPCVPSPCGANARCESVGNSHACACLPNFFGSPPNCRPECMIHSDCASNKACIRNKCSDPCPGACGLNAICNVFNHIPVCTCTDGYTGNPFSNCYPAPPPPSNEMIFYSTKLIQTKSIVLMLLPLWSLEDEIPQDKCNPNPCGPNSVCNDGVCTCSPEFFGDPYSGCRPECVLNSDCARDRACLRSKCVDPCPGTCASNALCNVINHVPMCSCPTGMEGNAFTQCRPIQDTPLNHQPCRPSPCGPNSQCREINGQAVCSCVPGYRGSPPTCHPECTVNSDCPSNRACANQKCIDPCPGACGVNAECRVVNHNPVCTCIPRYTGNALVNCHQIGTHRAQCSRSLIVH